MIYAYFKFVFLGVFSILISGVSAQQHQHSQEKIAYTKVEKMPQYPAGQKALMQYFADSMELPSVKWEEVEDNESDSKIILALIIDETGKVEDVSIIKHMNAKADAMYVRMARRLKFTPGMQGGKPVRVKYILPITFEYR